MASVKRRVNDQASLPGEEITGDKASRFGLLLTAANPEKLPEYLGLRGKNSEQSEWFLLPRPTDP